MSLIQIDRAIHELKAGRAINIDGIGFLHPEFADLNNLKKLKNPQLIITPARAHALFGDKTKGNVAISLKNIRASDIFLLIEGKLPASLRGIAEAIHGSPRSARDDKINGAALELGRVAQILPTAIRFENPDQDALKIKAKDIAQYQANLNKSLQLVTEAPLKLRDAKKASVKAFRTVNGGSEHLAIVVGKLSKEPLIRIHSSCYTGDLLGSLTCDCGDQLRGAIKLMDKDGGGIVLYLMQEGRGIGLLNKLRAYQLQADGLDTVEANEFLGFDDEERAFEPAAIILKKLGIKKVRLISNNPKKARELESYGIKVSKMVPMIIKHEHNHKYLSVKAAKSGHIIK